MHLFKDHEPGDDDRNDRKSAHGAENVLIVADQISDYKEAADGIQQKPGLINQGTGVEGENQDARNSAEQGPEEKYQVQAAKTPAENTVRRGEHGGEHADRDGQHDDAENKEVKTADQRLLAKRD